MANNEVYGWNGRLSVPCTDPALPTSGSPVRYGVMTGVAVTDEAADGNAALNTTVDFSMNVWNMLVDDDAGTGIAVGAAIYYHDTATGAPTTSHLNNVATAMDAYFGIALGTVAGNGTTIIPVLHVPVGVSTTFAGSAVTGAQLSAKQRARWIVGPRLDLSGAAVVETVIMRAKTALTLTKLYLHYTEASSGDAGVLVTAGTAADAAGYYTGTSEISKAKHYEKDCTLLATAVAASGVVTCSTAGGKVGTGEVQVCLEYTVDD